MSRHTPPTAEHSLARSTCQSAYSRRRHNVAPAGAVATPAPPASPLPARAGFTALPNAVLLATALSRDARLLYALLLHHAWQDRHCFPSHATLAAELGAGETMVRAYLCELEHAGLITRYRRGQGRTNVYVLHHVCQRATESGHAPARLRDSTGAPALGTAGSVASGEPRSAGQGAEQGARPAQTATPEPHQSAPNKDVFKQHTDLGSSKLRSHRASCTRKMGTIASGSDSPTQETGIPATSHLGPPGAGQEQGTDGAACTQRRQDPTYHALVEPVRELADELGDGAPLRSTISRAYNLLRRSGLSCQAFLVRLQEARAITWAHRTRITARSTDHQGMPRANLLPYCFAVLERLLGGDRHVPRLRHVDQPIRHASGPIHEPNPLWRAVLKELQTILAPAVFTRCRTGCVVSQQANLLQIAVPDRVTLHWFDTRLRRVLDNALATVGQEGMQVQFVLQAG